MEKGFDGLRELAAEYSLSVKIRLTTIREGDVCSTSFCLGSVAGKVSTVFDCGIFISVIAIGILAFSALWVADLVKVVGDSFNSFWSAKAFVESVNLTLGGVIWVGSWLEPTRGRARCFPADLFGVISFSKVFEATMSFKGDGPKFRGRSAELAASERNDILSR